jgi:hypothetical protein
MTRWKVIVTVLIISVVLFLIGDSRNEILEIHNNGAGMCMQCIGLE